MKKNRTLFELILGIVSPGILMQAAMCFIAKNYLYNAIGLWCGVIIAAVMAWHMNKSLEEALDLGEAGAVKHMRNGSLFRMILVVITVGVMVCFNLGSPIAFVVGLMTLKLSAYLNPFLHKLCRKNKE